MQHDDPHEPHDNWFERHSAQLLYLASIVALIVLVLLIAYRPTQSAGLTYRETFMNECAQYHKRYECAVMWRSGLPAPR